MKKNNRKVIKSFSNFQEEENWLHDMYKKGWMLESYGTETVSDNTYNFYKIIDNHKEILFKIDYREFNNKDEFDEYKELFEESGWNIISTNKRYHKHIFYTEDKNKNTEIFSDQQSFKDREKRKMKAALINFSASFIVFSIAILLYIIFKHTYIIGGGIIILFGSFKYIIDYLNHRKIFKSYLKV